MDEFPFDLGPQQWPQGFGSNQVDPRSQEHFQFKLKPHEGAKPGSAFEAHQNIDITIRTSFISRH